MLTLAGSHTSNPALWESPVVSDFRTWQQYGFNCHIHDWYDSLIYINLYTLKDLHMFLCPTIYFLHSLYLCCINDQLQNWVSFASCFVSLFNVFIPWMLMIIIIMSIIHFNFVYSIIIRHAIQLWKFVYDVCVYIYAPSRVHIGLFCCSLFII